jgi:tetratricopeptide (TPR) repeat protein
MIDADDRVEGNFKFPEKMEADGYVVRMGREEFSWWRTQIFKTDAKWKYEGVLHEYPACEKQNANLQKIEGKYNINARTLGARNVGITPVEKYKKDAEVLEKALIDEPTNTRYQFYLAQSYFDSQQWEKSMDAYKKRAEMGGWAEEVYYSLYRVAICRAMMDKPWPEVLSSFMDAYNYRPVRAEPLVHIAQVLRQKYNQPAAAFVYARQAAELPLPQGEILFVPDAIYNFVALDELGATAFAAGRPDLGYMACKKLLEENRLPKTEIERVQQNFNHYRQIMQQIEEQRKTFMASHPQEKPQSSLVSKAVNNKKFKERKKQKT